MGGRHWIRWLDRNWDFQKMCMFGVPEMHIDPQKNKWRYHIDTSYYGGFMEKAHEDFYRYILIYPGTGFFLFTVWVRIRKTTSTISSPSGMFLTSKLTA